MIEYLNIVLFVSALLSGSNFSLENNLPMFQLNAPVVIALMTTGAFSQIVGKLFSVLTFVPDNLLFIYAETS